MDAAAILRHLHAAGVNLALRGDRLSAWPADRLDNDMRRMIRDHKPELIEFIKQAHETTAQLLDLSARVCDHWRDGPEAREQMRQDVQQVPPHLRADLLDCLRKSYPGKKGAT